MRKTNMHGWKRQRKSMKRIGFAIILALIVFLAVSCRGRHWGGGHSDGGNNGHGCNSQWVSKPASP